MNAQRYLTTLKLNIGVCSALNSCSQMGSSISVPRAVVISPRSITSGQPKLFKSSATWALAPVSLPGVTCDKLPVHGLPSPTTLVCLPGNFLAIPKKLPVGPLPGQAGQPNGRICPLFYCAGRTRVPMSVCTQPGHMALTRMPVPLKLQGSKSICLQGSHEYLAAPVGGKFPGQCPDWPL